jgi:SPP1 family predicted phage head-tail adaptor
MSGLIGITTRTSARQCRVQIQNPGPRVPDGEGGTIPSWVDCQPAFMWAHIETALREGEREAADTTVTTVKRTVHLPYHPQVTTKTRLLYNGRILNVDRVDNMNERNATLDLTCQEVMP